ncbi:MAG: CPBP family intramembrane metalloprotease [Bryobacteraceae bacterium]|nr:CPBP family intramembrane metalloprotease [Bryobacteraceae bacterium]
MSSLQSRLFPILLVIGKLATFVIVFLAAAGVLASIVEITPRGDLPFRFAANLAPAVAAVFSNWLCMRLFEHQPLREIGLNWSGRNLLLGIAGGALFAALVVVGPVLAGVAEFEQRDEPSPGTGSAAGLIAFLAAAAAGEELQLRGYLLQALMQAIGVAPAVILTSGLFGVLHLGNPAASWASTSNTILAGAALAVAFWRSGSLWFPIGIHFGWNLVLPLAGAPLSGLIIPLTGYELVWRVGPVWNGGAYGPEGGVLTTLAFALWFLWILKAPLHRFTPYFLRDRSGATPPDGLPPLAGSGPDPSGPPAEADCHRDGSPSSSPGNA